MELNIKENKILSNIIKRYLDIIAISFLLLNFILWHVDIEFITLRQTLLYQYGIYILVSGLLLNIKNFNIRTFLKENIFFILIIVIAVYNSFSIIMDFNGIIVDMGNRSNILLMAVFPNYLLLLASFRQTNKKALVIGLIILSLLLVGYSGLAILHHHKGLESVFNIPLNGGDRESSLLNNPNALGEYAFIGIYSIFFISFISKHFFTKVGILLTPVLLYALLLSGSKTALYMSICLFIFLNLYFFSYDKKTKLTLLVIDIIVFIFMTLIYFGMFSEFIESLRLDLDLSGRDTIWINTFNIIQNYKLTGIGYNNFTYVYNELHRTITSPHNMLLGIYVELGIIGFILTLCWFGYLIIKNHSAIVTKKDDPRIKYLTMFNIFYLTFFIGQITEYAFLKQTAINNFFLILNAVNFKILSEVKNNEEKDLKGFIHLIFIMILIIASPLSINFNLSKFLMHTLLFGVIYAFIYPFIKPYLRKLKRIKSQELFEKIV